MATSGLMSTSNQYVKYYIECIQNSQSIANNTSNVTVKVWIKRINTGYSTYGNGTCYCTINGTSYNASITNSQVITSTPICILNRTLDIAHNSDGTKVLTMISYINHDMFSSSSQSYSQTLSTIPRTSSFTLSHSSIDAGGTIVVNISRASSSFTHAVGFYFGNHTVSLGTSVGTSVSYAIPISFLDAIPNSTSGSARIIVDTYSGSTRIGSTSKNFTITAPSSVVPSFTSLGITRVDNGVPPAWGIYVKGKSKATLAINGASGSYGSSISRYSISGGGYSTSSSSFTTNVLNTAGTNTFTATITDSRGRTATKTVTCSVVDYYTPYIDYVEAFRCDSSGVANNDGTYIKVKASFTYATLNGKNTFLSNVCYAVYDSITYSTPVNITNNTYSSAIGGGAISVDNSYSVKFRVADYFTSHEVFETVPTPSVTMDFKKGGKGIGIGKVSQTDDLLDIAWGTHIDGGLGVEKRVFLMDMLDVEGSASFYRGMSTKDISATGYIDCVYNYGISTKRSDVGGHYARIQASGNVGDVLFGHATSPIADTNYYLRLKSGGSDLQLGTTSIVTSWSNSNGNVIRYYDGTQICWVCDEPTNQTINSAYGSLFQSIRNWTYPASFVAIPAVHCSQFKHGTGASWGTVSDTTTTYASLRGIDAFSRASGTYCRISAIAIGRWK